MNTLRVVRKIITIIDIRMPILFTPKTNIISEFKITLDIPHFFKFILNYLIYSK